MSGLRERVLLFVAEPADKLVAQFFDTTGRFAATTFDMLPDNPPNRFTTTDLLAVTLLDVALTPDSVREVLDTKADVFGELLAAIPVDVDLWDATDEDLANAETLYWALRKLHKVGRTQASKVMARKRPKLIPVIDSVIHTALALGDNSWAELRICLSEPAVRGAIESIRPKNAQADSISTLRLLDAAVWMRCSGSRAARAARVKAGLNS